MTFNGRKTNLHAVWDTALLAATIQGDEHTDAAKLVGSITSTDVVSWKCGSTVDWANDTLGFPIRTIYGWLPSKYPSNIKNRILSTVRSDPRFRDKAESGGSLDPFRAIDVLVNHIRVPSAGGRGRFVRALVDYGQSDKPCDAVAGFGNVAPYEKRPDRSGRFRNRQRVHNTPQPTKTVSPTPLKSCGKINHKGKIRYHLDEDFEKLADEKSVDLREDNIADVEQFDSRAFENLGTVATVPARSQFKALLMETTRIMAEL